MDPSAKPRKLVFIDASEYGTVLSWWNRDISTTTLENVNTKQQSCMKILNFDVQKYQVIL
jgi:hypothetical protein